MLVLPAALITHIINSLKGMAEKQKRLYLGSLAMTLGYGGVTALSKAVGISRGCIHRGIVAVKAGDIFNFGDRSRARGGGRKRIEVKHREAIIAMGCFSDEQMPDVIDSLSVVDLIVTNASYGDPMRNNAWINVTVKSIGEAIYKKTGQRYSHIMDPATGKSAKAGLSSVTIVADSGFLADGLSTALYVMGPARAEAFWRESDDFECVLVFIE